MSALILSPGISLIIAIWQPILTPDSSNTAPRVSSAKLQLVMPCLPPKPRVGFAREGLRGQVSYNVNVCNFRQVVYV